MKKLTTVFFALAFVAGIFPQNVNADTYTVGSGGNYATLKAAFDAINAGTITGAITLQIIDNTTETASAVLYASGGSTSYTSVNIYPTLTGLTISGNLAAPLIDLNGADNVTIDGRVYATGSTKDLTITNTSTSATSGTSTIRYINDATSNTVKYCTLKGSCTTTVGGIIFFYTATTTGNNNNTIDNNDITNANGNRPYRAIRSTGTSGKPNSNNTISNNNIYDFWNTTQSGIGIFCATNTTAWTITGNSIYETTAFVTTTINAFVGIQLNGSTYTAIGNYIGGSAPLCGGTAFTKPISAFSNSFTGITVSDGIIQNNTVQNIAWSNPSSADFNGIYRIGNGNTDISSNTIGASTGTGSITISNTTDALVVGIRNYSTGTINIQNNNIGSITTINTDATKKTNFYGIYNTAGTLTVSNNIIGSTTTANSIHSSSASTTSAQRVYGIYSSVPTTINNNTIANMANGTTNGTAGTSGFISGIYSTSTASINNNIIRDLTIANANTAPDSIASVSGIALKGVYTRTVTGNTIYNLSNTYPSFAGSVTGLYFEGNTGSNSVSDNFIHSLSATAANGAGINGIKIASGATTYSNNIISLGDNTTANIYGIYETGAAGNNNNLYFNTVYIGGAPTTGTLNSYALYSGASTNTRDFRNNIFDNARSNNGGASGKHYAAYFNYADNTNLTLDYNDYYAPGTGGVLGYYNNADVTSLPLRTDSDAHSLNINPGFASAGGTTPPDYLSSATLSGVSGTGILDDFYEIIRNITTPKMGALEFASATNTIDVYIGESFQASYANLRTAFEKINDGTHTGDIVLKITGNQILSFSASLNASGTGSASYTSVTIYPTETGLTILGNLAAPLIDLNGADNVTIDGRVNATGSAKDLTITNISTSAIASTSTIRFINDASANIVRYCTIKGSSTDATAGILFFSTTSGTTGNDGNTIDHNNITNAADANRPVNAVYSSGTSSKENSGNIISNNNIYDFLNAEAWASSDGIYIALYSTGWTITGNSFYETTTAENSGVMINIDNISGNNFTISDNYIGGRAPQCDGSAMTINSTGNGFGGINLNVGTSIASNIQGNFIKNINITSTSDIPFYGIFLEEGAVNIGTTAGNTIGATTGNGSITTTNTSTDATSCGIYLGGSGNVNIQNNIIGSITTVGSVSYSHSFYGIANIAGATTISNNTIGSTATPNSIQASSSSQSTTSQDVYGILSLGSSGILTISGNTIANMYNAYAHRGATEGTISGIWTIDGSNTITNNTIYNLSTTSPSTEIAIVGLLQVSNADGQTVSGNTIHDLSDTYTISDSISIVGLYFGGTGSMNLVENNFIYGLSLSSVTASSVITGLAAGAGATTYANNIINIGGGLSLDYNIMGFYESAATSNHNNLYFNTVYIGGVVTSGGNCSYALVSGASTTIRELKNNIFDNARSNNGGIGNHYAIKLSGNTNLTIDYNDYYASGTGGVIGNFDGTDETTFAAWKAATGQDVHSLNINPGFANAGGTLPYNYIPSAGLPGIVSTGVTTDYYGTTRLDPPTMGAWEALLALRWTGATSTDWSEPSNWNSNTVPTSADDVEISSVPSNQPHVTAIISSPATCNNLTVNTGATLTIDPGKALIISGNFINK
jgi:hypothetical protein